MIERWVLFYDGACPVCVKAKSKLINLLPNNIRLTVVDLNGPIAQSKGYSKEVVLETQSDTIRGHRAWLQVLQHTKYRWMTQIVLRPGFILGYWLISKNRKLISKII